MKWNDSNNVHLNSGQHLTGGLPCFDDDGKTMRFGIASLSSVGIQGGTTGGPGATGVAVDVGHPTAVGAGCAVMFAGVGFTFWRPVVCVVLRCRAVSSGRRNVARRDCVEGNGVNEFPKRTASTKRGMLHNPQRFEGRGCRVGSSSCYALRCISVSGASKRLPEKLAALTGRHRCTETCAQRGRRCELTTSINGTTRRMHGVARRATPTRAADDEEVAVR